MLSRLDAYGTDDRWRKPRHGQCELRFCHQPVINHPVWRHRLAALIGLWSDRMGWP